MEETDQVFDYIPNPKPDQARVVDDILGSFPKAKPGEIVLSDGRVVDRTKVVFLLREDHRDKTILYATDRAYKMAGGTLRRIVPKETKQQRKERKKNNR